MRIVEINSPVVIILITIAVLLLFWSGIVPAFSLLQPVSATSGGGGTTSEGIRADFNGDGIDDLAIGVPGEDIGSIDDAGAVNVIYGSSGVGLASTDNQLWHQNTPGIAGTSEINDHFGRALR